MDKDKELVWKRLNEVRGLPSMVTFNADGTKMTGPLGLTYTLSTAWNISTATIEKL